MAHPNARVVALFLHIGVTVATPENITPDNTLSVRFTLPHTVERHVNRALHDRKVIIGEDAGRGAPSHHADQRRSQQPPAKTFLLHRFPHVRTRSKVSLNSRYRVLAARASEPWYARWPARPEDL